MMLYQSLVQSAIQVVLAVAIAFSFAALACSQIDIEKPPIRYSGTKADNAVTVMIERIESGELSIDYDAEFGYLPALLEAMDIPVSSQGLVFSKTSMQIRYISPRSPRAVYFNDDTYVGWLKGSRLLEISTTDKKIGAAFYLVEMNPEKAMFEQAYGKCLTCHASTLTQGVPGHTVRSVVPKPNGYMEVSKKSYVTDHCSPLEERWGGWYVTGRHGEMEHMGNAVSHGDKFSDEETQNWLTLNKVLDTSKWLSTRSDIVALMVLEHQTQMHNTYTRANFELRCRKYEFEKDHPETSSFDSETKTAERRRFDLFVDELAEQVVDYMLFVREAKLESRIKGSSKFVRKFVARGPHDVQGRSLRMFDLHKRLFRYPCSYLIYSNSFDGLEPVLKARIYDRLWTVLTKQDRSKKYDHLQASTGNEIIDILNNTKKDLPAYWNSSRQSLSD